MDITYLRFAFCGELGEHVAGQALDEGIVRTVWLTADEIRASVDMHRSPLLLTCMEDYLAGKRYPLALVTTDPSVYPRSRLRRALAAPPVGAPSSPRHRGQAHQGPKIAPWLIKARVRARGSSWV
jgi:hypothetical protein